MEFCKTQRHNQVKNPMVFSLFKETDNTPDIYTERGWKTRMEKQKEDGSRVACLGDDAYSKLYWVARKPYFRSTLKTWSGRASRIQPGPAPLNCLSHERWRKLRERTQCTLGS